MMGAVTLHRAWVVIPMVGVACGGEAGAHSAAVIDSAGVTIVTNDPPRGFGGVSIRVTPELSIGTVDGTTEYLFGRIADVAVDRSGRLLVVDQLVQDVKVYRADGTFLFRFGGPGRGPGEMSDRVTGIHAALDSIYVTDNALNRINVYDGAGNAVRTVPVRGFHGLVRSHPLGDGRLLVRWINMAAGPDGRFGYWDALLAVGPGGALDTLVPFEYPPADFGNRETFRLPLLPNAGFFDVLAGDRIAWSALGSDEIRIHRADGTLERIVRHRAWKRRALSRGDRADLEAVYRVKSNRPTGPLPSSVVFPDSLPAITALRGAPDGGFWVQRLGPVADIDPAALAAPGLSDWLGGPRWDVFDRAGVYRGTATLPPRFRLTRIVEHAVVGVFRDDQDVERVARLAVAGES